MPEYKMRTTAVAGHKKIEAQKWREVNADEEKMLKRHEKSLRFWLMVDSFERDDW